MSFKSGLSKFADKVYAQQRKEKEQTNKPEISYEEKKAVLLEDKFEPGVHSDGWYTLYTHELKQFEQLAIAEGKRQERERIEGIMEELSKEEIF